MSARRIARAYVYTRVWEQRFLLLPRTNTQASPRACRRWARFNGSDRCPFTMITAPYTDNKSSRRCRYYYCRNNMIINSVIDTYVLIQREHAWCRPQTANDRSTKKKKKNRGCFPFFSFVLFFPPIFCAFHCIVVGQPATATPLRRKKPKYVPRVVLYHTKNSFHDGIEIV